MESAADAARAYLEHALPKGGWTAASRALGRDHAYIQQYLKRKTPVWLPERDRDILVRLYGLNDAQLRPPPRVIEQAHGHGDNETQIELEVLNRIANDARVRQILRGWSRLEAESEKDLVVRFIEALASKHIVAPAGTREAA